MQRMIASFFQSLDRHKVEYLLISGQATILYGAATFSEDIDLWINPDAENCERFIESLRESQARYYKLTPALTAPGLQRGHGFHFVLPGAAENVFLDIMGNPPRVGPFATAAATARTMQTQWGAITTIGLQPLVELKKTQRLEDYPIISKLALAWFDQPDCARDTVDLCWAIQNIFTLPELTIFFAEHPQAVRLTSDVLSDEIREFGRLIVANDVVGEGIERAITEGLQRRIGDLQQADRRYWRGIIKELKELRAAGKLMPEGQAV